jgi:DNA polymerase-3 subunit epsilon
MVSATAKVYCPHNFPVALDFVAIDFETANSSAASPCAVGMVRVRDGQIQECLAMLFRPPYGHHLFDAGNIAIHGIRPEDVQDAPDFVDALPDMLLFTEGMTLVAHNASFDMGVLAKASGVVGFDLPPLRFACSLGMARKTYHDLASYRLSTVAYSIGHEEFQHHDALADADACARIVIHMAQRHEVESLGELLEKTSQRLAPVVV